ncbi:unnamed protein product [Gordionus sp. m RMFG-2023]
MRAPLFAGVLLNRHREHYSIPYAKILHFFLPYYDFDKIAADSACDEIDHALNKGELNLQPTDTHASEEIAFRTNPINFKSLTSNHLAAASSARSISVPPGKRNNLNPHNLAHNSKLNTPLPGSAGAMDEESFYDSFEEVPKLHISSVAEMDDTLNKIREILSTDKTEWNKRNEEMRKIRSVVLSGNVRDYPEFLNHLRQLEPAFQLALKDLRSQVVREVCITIGFLAQTFGIRFEHTAEFLLPNLICLMPNSVKIMSTSVMVAMKFILKHVHSNKLIPVLVQNMSSKNREIRKNLCDFLAHILHTWDTSVLEKHSGIIQEAIKKGLQDADSDARASSRKAYWGFADHFKEQAEILIQSLDSGKQKMLRGEISNSSSNNSLYRSNLPHHPRMNTQNTDSSNMLSTIKKREVAAIRKNTMSLEDIARKYPPLKSNSKLPHKPSLMTHYPSASYATHFPSSNPPYKPPVSSVSSTSSIINTRSNSAIDHQAALRARKRNMNGAAAFGVNGGNSKIRYHDYPLTKLTQISSRPRICPPNFRLNQPHNYQNPPTTARVPTNSKSVSSMSQPGSRSNSPTNRLNAHSAIYNYRANLNSAHQNANNLNQGNGVTKYNTMGRSNQYQQTSSAAFNIAKPSMNRLVKHNATKNLLSKFGKDFETSSNVSETSSKIGRIISTPYPKNNANQHNDSIYDATPVTQQQVSPSHQIRSEEELSDHSSSFCSESSFRQFQNKYFLVHTAASSSNSAARDNFNGNCINNDPNIGGAMAGGVPNFYGNTLGTDMDSSEILSLLSSTNWADRKEGLIHILRFFRSGKELKPKEIRPIMENFSKMFMDPHSKVFSIFLDALIEFISIYHEDLQDWLYILMTKLLTKMGQELLSSIQTKCQKLLDLITSSFSFALQFEYLGKFLTDQTMTPNYKVKIAVLGYALSIIPSLTPLDFTVDSDTQCKTMSKIISLTGEPKSVEVRKLSTCILLALFDLNPATFTMNLHSMPKSQQDISMEILRNHVGPSLLNQISPHPSETFMNGGQDLPLQRNYVSENFAIPSSEAASVDDHNFSGESLTSTLHAEPCNMRTPNLMSFGTPYSEMERSGPDTAKKGFNWSYDEESRNLLLFSSKSSNGLKPVVPPKPRLSLSKTDKSDLNFSSSSLSPNLSGDFLNGGQNNTPNHNDKPVSKIPLLSQSKKRQIHSKSPLTTGDSYHLSENLERTHRNPVISECPNIECTQKSPVILVVNGTGGSRPVKILTNKTRDAFDMSTLNKELDEMVNGDEDVERTLSNKLAIMKNEDINRDELMEALTFVKCLVNNTSSSSYKGMWERQFNYLLAILIKLLTQEDNQLKCNALGTLKQLIKFFPQLFLPYTETTYLKLLNVINCDVKEVSRMAEETCHALAKGIPPSVSFRVINPLIQTAPYPTNLHAIKILHQMVDNHERSELAPMLNDIISNLIQNCENVEGTVRKCCVFCLVSVYSKFGEEVLPHFQPLSSQKRKILQLYIDRANQHNTTTTLSR